MDMEMGPVETNAIAEAAAASLTCSADVLDACSHDFANLGEFVSSMPSSPSASTPTTLSLAHLRPCISKTSSSSYPVTDFVTAVTLANGANLQNNDILGFDAPTRVGTFNASSGSCASSFTPEQWVQLTYQMFAFKHVAAGTMPPPAVVIGSLNSDFKLGMSGSIGLQSALHPALVRGSLDLEPWRCRRTDGKKWRCAKDAVPDKKYCEKHVHRGRNHRARGKNGVSATSGPSINNPCGSSSPTTVNTYSTLFDCRGSPWRAALAEQCLIKSLRNLGSVASSRSTSAPMIADLVRSNASVAGETRIHSGDHNEQCFSQSSPSPALAGWSNKAEAGEPDLKRSKSARVGGESDDFLGLGSGHWGLAIKRDDENAFTNRFRSDWITGSAALGGPLAEALQSKAGEGGLISLEESWDAVGRRETLMSPTGVLQSRSAFGGSSSESSSGASSPRSLMKINLERLIK